MRRSWRRAASALVTGAPARVLHQRVAALQRPLRVVRGERQAQPLERRARAARRAAAALRSSAAGVGVARACRAARSADAGRRGLALQRAARRVPSARCSAASAAARARAQLAQLLVQARAVAGDVVGRRAREPRERARALDDRAPALALQPRGERRAARARAAAQSTGTAASAACVGVEQATAATSSISVRSAWWPTEAIDRHAQQRHRAAQRLVAEREQVGERAAAAGDDHDVDLRAGREVLQRARDRRGGAAVLDRRERPHQPPGPAAPAQRRERRRRAPCRPRR